MVVKRSQGAANNRRNEVTAAKGEDCEMMCGLLLNENVNST